MELIKILLISTTTPIVSTCAQFFNKIEMEVKNLNPLWNQSEPDYLGADFTYDQIISKRHRYLLTLHPLED